MKALAESITMLFKLCSYVMWFKSYCNFCTPKLGHILTGPIPDASRMRHCTRYEL